MDCGTLYLSINDVHSMQRIYNALVLLHSYSMFHKTEGLSSEEAGLDSFAGILERD